MSANLPLAGKRCAFVVEDWPLSRVSAGGAGALNVSHFELLAATACTLTLLVLRHPRAPKGFADFMVAQPQAWQEIRERCAEWRILELAPAMRTRAPLRHALSGLVDPGQLYLDLEPAAKQRFQTALLAMRPDLIWAEHLLPAALSARTSSLPVIYGHHDWNHRIKAHRRSARRRDLRQRLKTWLRRRFEEDLVRRVAGVVSGSSSEAAMLSALGVRQVVYLPPTFTPQLDPTTLALPAGPPRIVHLGGLKTTATRVGLERFLAVVWPTLRAGVAPDPKTAGPPALWVVGDLDGASPQLHAALIEAPATCPGFVADPTAVLRPGDLHVMPWEHDTGTRTRIPMVLSHGQVVVAVRAGVACFPELVHGENCVLVERLEDLGEALRGLLCEPATRLRLAQAGLRTVAQYFTREALQPRCNAWLNSWL